MIRNELLEILVCPENHGRLTRADGELIRRVNDAVAAGRLRNRSGERVAERLDEALVREDGALLYAVRDGIPVMLVDEAIPLDQLT